PGGSLQGLSVCAPLLLRSHRGGPSQPGGAQPQHQVLTADVFSAQFQGSGVQVLGDVVVVPLEGTWGHAQSPREGVQLLVGVIADHVGEEPPAGAGPDRGVDENAHVLWGTVTARQGTGLDRIMVLEGRPWSARVSITSSKCSMERTAMSSMQQSSPVTRCTWRISGSSSEERWRRRQCAPKHSMRTSAVTGRPAAVGSTCAW